MKQYLCLFFSCFLLCCAYAESEKISIIAGDSHNIQTPFVIESFQVIPRNSDKITVEAAESQLRIIGNAIGECNLTITGGGVTRTYGITVKSNIANTLKRLRSDLNSLPELDISINHDYIVIRGTVNNPDNWDLFQKVLPLYKDKVHSFAVFRPSAETVLGLKKALTDAGFTFCEPNQKPEIGQLSMQLSADAVIITGEMYSQASVAQIHQILATQSWLSVDAKPDATKGKIHGIVNLSVIETVLQVDIVYVGISDSDSKSIGTGSVPTASLNLGVIYDLIAGRGTNKTAQFGGNMDATVKFLAANGVSRTYNAGHVSFANNGEGMLHTGGTISVKVSGIENGSLQNIDYGLKIKVNGSLLSPTRVKLALDLENTSVVSSSGDAYSRSVDSTKQTVMCDLDRTIVVAGSRKIAQDTRKSGLPILRNTPVLKWFVSEDGDSSNETRLLILACPRLVKHNPDVQINIPLEQETAPTYSDAKTDNNTRIENEKRYRGWMSWMNWFSW